MTRVLPIVVILAFAAALAWYTGHAIAGMLHKDQVCISAALYQDGRESQTGVECHDR